MFFSLMLDPLAKLSLHVLGHDVQGVDVEFARDVTHDVTCLCHPEDRVIDEAFGLDVAEVMLLTLCL